MHRFLPLLCGLSISAIGCSKKGNIWLIEIDTTEGDGLSCAREFNTNFSGALASDQASDGALVESYTDEGPKALFYAKIVDLSSNQVSLNSGTLLLPGERDGNKAEFSWTSEQKYTRTVDHEADYDYTVVDRQTFTTTIDMEFSGRTASGSILVEEGVSTDESESDTWGEEVSRDLGDVGEITWSARSGTESNGRDSSECDGDDCRKYSATVCGVEAPITATLTDLSKGEDFSSLVTLTNYGSFKTTDGSNLGGGYDTGW
ncbi:MAG: hypothetical protein CL927_06615 [Deltaproteobacteria bacterium]|mgnify:CR=1 FL=1|nr:hypothetical protein [Deltaproteobacteria bacterium]HCH66469.1 hypothetical protein [Deltaproteobacteria bacterium]